MAGVHDAEASFTQERYAGTDQVLRIDGTRGEALSCMAAGLYDLPVDGKAEKYRRRTHGCRRDWPKPDGVAHWGATSFRPDGAAVAIRVARE